MLYHSGICAHYAPCRNNSSHRTLPSSRRSRTQCFFFPSNIISLEAGPYTFLVPVSWGAETGETGGKGRFNTVQWRFPHLYRNHISVQRYAKCVMNLTKWIVRTHAYPAAYGGFSDVWGCQLRMKRSPERVAIKAVRPLMLDGDQLEIKRQAVERELDIWLRLDHRNVLPLYGIVEGFGPLPALVCPWAENGTLSEYLEKSELQLDLKRRLSLLRDIAKGLKYLHSENIVHGDLSGSNVLIDADGRAFLSDFGLSAIFAHVTDTTPVTGLFEFPGNIRWAAPELFDACIEGKPVSQLSSRQADIYSFGSVMLQILSGKVPFYDIQRVAEIVIMISRGSRPPSQPTWDGRDIPELWSFVETCWASPSERPSSRCVVEFIRSQLIRC